MRPEYERFFKECVGKLGLSEADHKMDSTYCQIKTVVPGWNVHFEWHFKGEPFSCLEVGVHFESYPELSQWRLNSVVHHRDEIQQRTQLPVAVEEQWGGKGNWSRMYVAKNTCRRELDGPDLLGWAVDTMRVFQDIVGPSLTEMCRRGRRRC